MLGERGIFHLINLGCKCNQDILNIGVTNVSNEAAEMMAILALFFVKYIPLFHLIPNKKPRHAAGFFCCFNFNSTIETSYLLSIIIMGLYAGNT
jgi:hypothetical protein